MAAEKALKRVVRFEVCRQNSKEIGTIGAVSKFTKCTFFFSSISISLLLGNGTLFCHPTASGQIQSPWVHSALRVPSYQFPTHAFPTFLFLTRTLFRIPHDSPVLTKKIVAMLAVTYILLLAVAGFSAIIYTAKFSEYVFSHVTISSFCASGTPAGRVFCLCYPCSSVFFGVYMERCILEISIEAS